ncbi:MAG: BlaI/MecI/CopY family transcriptional regulator [Verrucomicrobiales bacterium]|nr:BlaI/MecI/CopY family transcriptional regulator [Verrucomicrobiales bacterium]
MKDELPKPTEREMEIIGVLWRTGPSPVREVLEELNRDRKPPLAYTTVLRFFQIMLEKGLVTRREGGKGHIYETSVPAEKTKTQLTHDLLNRVFAGSTKDLVLHALGGRKMTAEELDEIRDVISEMDQEEKKK